MNYQEALDFVKQSQCLGSKLGLERLQKLLAILDHPEKKLKFIHVAGTNGKGSTAMMISSMLTCAGYKTGLFTSPCLEVVNDQIRMNCEIITNEEFAKSVNQVQDVVMNLEKEDYPTEFELITAVAFTYFVNQNCDLVVLEAGLGGVSDATNVIPASLVSVITNIGMDHTALLGDTLENIAACKAGIIKENGVVVCYEQEKEVEAVIKAECEKKHATYVV
ncbi:MAG: Mur ligase family protein, partial [Clostridiales bacterium]|nr:Mur ligase family protein [Clostridiales bacterium]